MLEQNQPSKRRRKPNPHAALTPRQQEIANLIAKGMTSRQIGEALGISERTVGKHREDLMKRLGTKNAVQTAKLVPTGTAQFVVLPDAIWARMNVLAPEANRTALIVQAANEFLDRLEKGMATLPVERNR